MKLASFLAQQTSLGDQFINTSYLWGLLHGWGGGAGRATCQNGPCPGESYPTPWNWCTDIRGRQSGEGPCLPEERKNCDRQSLSSPTPGRNYRAFSLSPEFPLQFHLHWVLFTLEKLLGSISLEEETLWCVSLFISLCLQGASTLHLLPFHPEQLKNLKVIDIQKTKIMASGPITSWEIDGETVSDFIFLGSKITADGDCSHEIKRCLLLGRKVMTNLTY